MKLRTRIVNWLYFRFGTRDIVAMTRLQMMGVDLTIGEANLDNIALNEKMAIANEAQSILDSGVFKMAVDIVKERFMRHARDQADGELQMFCDRFSINGASMVWEEIDRLSKLVAEPQEQTKEPHNLME